MEGGDNRGFEVSKGRANKKERKKKQVAEIHFIALCFFLSLFLFGGYMRLCLPFFIHIYLCY